VLGLQHGISWDNHSSLFAPTVLLNFAMLGILAKYKHSSFFGSLANYEENEVFQIRVIGFLGTNALAYFPCSNINEANIFYEITIK
jgi:hypothetical protein